MDAYAQLAQVTVVAACRVQLERTRQDCLLAAQGLAHFVADRVTQGGMSGVQAQLELDRLTRVYLAAEREWHHRGDQYEREQAKLTEMRSAAAHRIASSQARSGRSDSPAERLAPAPV